MRNHTVAEISYDRREPPWAQYAGGRPASKAAAGDGTNGADTRTKQRARMGRALAAAAGSQRGCSLADDSLRDEARYA
jgi:hypothetical protein